MTGEARSGPALPPVRPLCRAGTGWRAHGLEGPEDGEYVFRALPGQGLLLGLLRGVGVGALALGVLAWIGSGEIGMFLFCALVAGIFLGTAAWLGPAVRSGARVRPAARMLELPAGLSGRGKVVVRFDEIAAVQYVPYRKHGTEPFRVIHGEVDLLLRSGRRLNVVHHAALERMRADAAMLARVTGVPLHEHPVYEPGATRHPT